MKNLEPLTIKLIEKLKQKKLTIGLAESCTGGLFSSQLTAISGVSEVFMGSVVCYSNKVKMDLLGVQLETLKKNGAVSLQVASELAQGARRSLNVDVSIAITGIAGPNGGSATKPVGTICFCILGPQFEIIEQKFFAGSRLEIQNQSVEFAINSALNALN